MVQQICFFCQDVKVIYFFKLFEKKKKNGDCLLLLLSTLLFLLSSWHLLTTELWPGEEQHVRALGDCCASCWGCPVDIDEVKAIHKVGTTSTTEWQQQAVYIYPVGGGDSDRQTRLMEYEKKAGHPAQSSESNNTQHTHQRPLRHTGTSQVGWQQSFCNEYIGHLPIHQDEWMLMFREYNRYFNFERSIFLPMIILCAAGMRCMSQSAPTVHFFFTYEYVRSRYEYS